jgi:streptomycin 6-kinase
MDALSSTQGERVLLHQDLHGDNVLGARREPWLAIDPKPLLGERELSLTPIIRSYEFATAALTSSTGWMSSAWRSDWIENVAACGR